MNSNNKNSFNTFDSSSSFKMNTDRKNEKTVPSEVEEYLVLLLVILEALLIGVLMALNYIFRYDSTIRYSSDMINFTQVLLPCDIPELNYELSRPFYDYDSSTSLDGLELTYGLTEWVFFLCLLLTPIGIFCIIEISVSMIFGKKRKAIEMFDLKVPYPIWRSTRIVGGYLLGGAIAGLFTSLMKLSIASPRPHFVSVCFNNQSHNNFEFCQDQNYWKPSLECFNEKENTVEALKAFPSYHATLAVYSAVFTSAYIAVRVKIKWSFALPVLLMFCIMLMGFFGATHRLSSGYSFPKDIIGGAFIGLVVAYFMVVYRLNGFRENSSNYITHSKRKSRSSKYKKTGESEDSEFDSAGSSDYDNFVTKVRTYPFLPRLQSEMPLQAVNPTMQVDNRLKVPHHHDSPLPKRGTIPGRSHSSAEQTVREERTTFGYNIPRQRQSVPPARDGFAGHTNYGFTSSPREHKTGILSAYSPSTTRESLPSTTRESLSRF